LKAKDDDIDSLELEFLARDSTSEPRLDRLANSSLTPMLLDIEDYPPVRDDAASRFFAKPEDAARPEPVFPVEDTRHSRFHSPAAKERQRYLARYVTGAVAVSGVICLAAFVRLAAAAPDLPRASAIAPAAIAEATPPVANPATSQPASPPEVAADPAPALAQEPAPEHASAPARESAPAAAHEASPAVESPAPSAADSKQAAMRALEHGKWNVAIAAAEQSVRLDASDAEAWLILGGAYQERGSNVAAHRAYVSCSKQARPSHARSECESLAKSN
jgi:hypothetical protein